MPRLMLSDCEGTVNTFIHWGGCHSHPSQNMALSSFQLFLGQVKSSPESLRMKVLQIVFDIMMTYEKDLFGGEGTIVSNFFG